MPNRVARLVTASAMAFAAGAAAAEPPSAAIPSPAPDKPPAAPADASTAVSGVTVEAPTVKAEQRFQAQVGQFVHGQARPGIGPVKQITQWSDPVCPSTQGLTQAMDDFVSRRITEVARRVGAPGRGACREANVLVLFTTRPQQLMDDVRDHHARLLGYHFNGETRALATFEPPIKSWYVTSTSINRGVAKNDADWTLADEAYRRFPPGFCLDMTQCRILPRIKSRFHLALVVIDAGRTEGKEIGAVADEIAMTVLSRPGPRQGCSPLPSVMDVLDPACPDSDSVEGLTAYDEAFLKALYAPHDTEQLAVERAELERAVQAIGPGAQAGP
jgi:hypothetical protein